MQYHLFKRPDEGFILNKQKTLPFNYKQIIHQ